MEAKYRRVRCLKFATVTIDNETNASANNLSFIAVIKSTDVSGYGIRMVSVKPATWDNWNKDEWPDVYYKDTTTGVNE